MPAIMGRVKGGKLLNGGGSHIVFACILVVLYKSSFGIPYKQDHECSLAIFSRVALIPLPIYTNWSWQHDLLRRETSPSTIYPYQSSAIGVTSTFFNARLTKIRDRSSTHSVTLELT